MDLDFQPPKTARADTSPSGRRHRLPLTLAVVIVAVGVLWILLRQPVSQTEARTAPTAALVTAPPTPAIQRAAIDGEIKAGDTFSTLLGDRLTAQQIHGIALQSRPVFALTGLCVGQPYRICTENGIFKSFQYDINRDDRLTIRKEADGFAVSRGAIPYQTTTALVRGTITSSLFETVAASGENPELALALADIFAWDIDFIRDIREGDSFQVLVEKRSLDGKPAGYGQILAAEFTNDGDTYRAFLYRDGEHPPAYYDADGNSVRKAFLRAPLAFTRISSGFSMHRLHPITHRYKPHPAIDYAAPTGTPIKAVGDGTVVVRTYNRFNGNYVKIRHNATYQTMYNHMSRFAHRLKVGSHVAQGQVIGYVGATGMATGPHLDFRMYKNGTPVNPYRVKIPNAAPVAKAHLPVFRAAIAPKMALLEGHGPLQAMAEPLPATAGVGAQ
jgi:murein DD-endopeptidase MepM/ murein hydrolase activator NlpD